MRNALLAVLVAGAVYAATTVRQNGTKIGVANQINCTGGISCSVDGGTVTLNASIPDGGPPVVDTDTKGSYTFGGFTVADYQTGAEFARFAAINDGTTTTIHFLKTTESSTSSASNGFVQLVEEGSGVVVCRVQIQCDEPVGTGFNAPCTVDETPGPIKAGETYFFRWESGACDGHSQGGNATIVITEDEWK